VMTMVSEDLTKNRAVNSPIYKALRPLTSSELVHLKASD